MTGESVVASIGKTQRSQSRGSGSDVAPEVSRKLICPRDFIKKGMLAGVGAAVVSKETAEKALNELVEKGKISTSEAREMADKIVDQGREEYEKSRDEMQNWFEEMLHRGNVASQKDFVALEARVAALEAKLAAQETSGE